MENFTWTLSLSSLLQVVSIFGSAAMFLVGLKWQMKRQDERLGHVEVNTARLADSYQQVAITIATMASYEKRISRLEDGK